MGKDFHSIKKNSPLFYTHDAAAVGQLGVCELDFVRVVSVLLITPWSRGGIEAELTLNKHANENFAVPDPVTLCCKQPHTRGSNVGLEVNSKKRLLSETK